MPYSGSVALLLQPEIVDEIEKVLSTLPVNELGEEMRWEAGCTGQIIECQVIYLSSKICYGGLPAAILGGGVTTFYQGLHLSVQLFCFSPFA